MNNTAYLQAQIADIRAKLARPCTAFTTGGVRPSNSEQENWIGRVYLCRADEAQTPLDANGEPLYALAQFYLPALPYLPPQLQGIQHLTLFIGAEFPDRGANGEGWLIREYRATDTLIRHEFPQLAHLKPFPLQPQYQAIDLPLWDGGGIPEDIEDRICELENDAEEKDESFEYYGDICGEDDHCYDHKIGGYPSYCQSGIGTDFGDGCEFVLQISSDDKAGLNVVDSGSLMFARNADGQWRLYYDFY